MKRRKATSCFCRSEFYKVFLLSLLPFVLVNAQTATFWIIENPAPLVIYDRYEQRLSDSDKAALAAFGAWQIIKSDQLLSDQYTKVIQAQHQQRDYFIQVDDQGLPANRNQAGRIDIVRTATIIGDTLRIKQDNCLFLENGISRNELQRDQLIFRLFESSSRYYARTLNNRISGWLSGNIRQYSEPFRVVKKSAIVEQQLYEKINRIVEDYNRKLEKLFVYLNQKYDQQLPLPGWKGQQFSDRLIYHFEPKRYQQNFCDSKQYLIQELQDLLYGSDYRLTVETGQIIIIKSSD